MNKHTAGPWGVSFNGKCTWNIEETGRDRRHIASVERQQDAHLIAACPNLYEACTAMIAALDGTYLDDRQRAREQMDAAILKAEGGE